MSFRLNEFVSEINKSGVARPSYFSMIITPPLKLIQRYPEFKRAITLRVESASLPSRIILNQDQRYYGPIRRIPYGYNSQDLIMSVILSEDMREREMFSRWQDLMVGNSRTRRDGDGFSKEGIFDAGYYNDAIMGASIELRTYATSPIFQGEGNPKTLLGEATEIARAIGINPSVLGINIKENRIINHCVSVKLIEPFPSNINEVPLAWNDDGYSRLNIIMQHRYIQEQVSYKGNDSEDSQSISGLIRNGIQSFQKFKPVIAAIKTNGLGGAVNQFGKQIKNNALGGLRGIGRI